MERRAGLIRRKTPKMVEYEGKMQQHGVEVAEDPGYLLAIVAADIVVHTESSVESFRQPVAVVETAKGKLEWLPLDQFRII